MQTVAALAVTALGVALFALPVLAVAVLAVGPPKQQCHFFSRGDGIQGGHPQEVEGEVGGAEEERTGKSG